MSDICVVLITAPNQEEAALLGRQLVEEGLAACVNILPGVRSIYRWEGRVTDEAEVLMLVKTRLDQVEGQLVERVRQLHSYSEPEIIALPVAAGSASYIGWILQNTSTAG